MWDAIAFLNTDLFRWLYSAMLSSFGYKSTSICNSALLFFRTGADIHGFNFAISEIPGEGHLYISAAKIVK